MMNLTKTTIYSVLATSILMIASSAVAGQVEVCKQYIERQEHRCVIKAVADDQLETGGQVVLYTKDAHWVATGDVVLKKGDFVVAIFKDADPKIHRGLAAKFENNGEENTLNYELAFANP